MPGGRRNPLAMNKVVHDIHQAVFRKTNQAHDVKDLTKQLAEQKLLDIPHVDVQIQFIGASGLPKTDVVGSADPYFVANIDHKIHFVSTVISNTLAPVWNELWLVKNVPNTADLHVEVMDKDAGAPHDDYIGKFKTSISPGAKELEIESLLLKRDKGHFWLKIESKPSTDPNAKNHPYIFDGPIRYSRHYSPTVGLLTNLDDARLYSTWKIYLRGVPLFFEDRVQHWNRNYKAAQSIFEGPASIAVRSGVQAGHRMLYARSTRNDFGVISSKNDILRILHGELTSSPKRQSNNDSTQPAGNYSDTDKNNDNDHHDTDNNSTIGDGNDNNDNNGSNGSNKSLQSKPSNNHTKSSSSINAYTPSRERSAKSAWAHRVKPAVYTYIISVEDDSFRFSETGAAFFVDFASKHALHSNCATSVRYSGEFHPRPKGGWTSFIDEGSTKDEDVDWELVIDNNSGTYSPDPSGLKDLKALLEYNFPGFTVIALDHDDEELKESRDACRKYAVEKRGVKEEELQPHMHDAAEITLMKHASVTAGNGGGEG